ncbi:MAG: hypothetical protein H6883_04990 [Rhodobiaceae bacterium]|nr:hypothetical protein [Rhodobiaceae bacterium]
MKTSLGLTGDFDDDDMFHDLSEAFGYCPVFNEARSCETVGDVFEGFAEPLGYDVSHGRCATAMCFYRLRNLLQPRLDVELRPKTPIRDLSGLSARKISKIIRNEGGMRPVIPYGGWWVAIAFYLIAGLPIALMIFDSLSILSVPGWVMLASIPATITSFVLLGIFTATFPPEIKTFGDIVRIVASQNISMLADGGARLGRKEAWTVVADIASKYSTIQRDAISPETLIYRQPKKAVA